MLCLGQPEVTVRIDDSRIDARSTAWSYDIRRRSFCLLVAWRDASGESVPRLVLRARPDERRALCRRPPGSPPPGPAQIALWSKSHQRHRLAGDPRARNPESYRVLAPKKLTALLD